MTDLLFFLTGALYLAGTAGYVVFIFRQKDSVAGTSAWVMLAGLVCHSISLITEWFSLGHVPAVNLSQSLSLLAWSMVAGYLLLLVKANVRVLGSFVAPLALMLIIMAAAGSAGKPQPVAGFGSAWLTVHVIAAFLGDGILAVAALAGVMYLLQEGQLKSKRQGWIYTRLPALTTLDNLGRLALLIGFPLLTLGMLTGAVYGYFRTGVYWSWAPREVWSLITWAIYAIILHQRLTVGWQGRKAAWLAIAGFGLAAFAFIGAGYLFDDYHSFAAFTRAGGAAK